MRQVGHGGMGTVPEAEQEDPTRDVALKLIRAADAGPELAARSASPCSRGSATRSNTRQTCAVPLDLSRRSLPDAVAMICEEPPLDLGAVEESLCGDLATFVAKALAFSPGGSLLGLVRLSSPVPAATGGDDLSDAYQAILDFEAAVNAQAIIDNRSLLVLFDPNGTEDWFHTAFYFVLTPPSGLF